MLMQEKKIAFLISHPIQYFSPLFRQMASDSQFDLTVYFCYNPADGDYDQGFGQKVTWDIPLLQGYKYHFLKSLSGNKMPGNRFWSLVNFEIVKLLLTDKNEIIIVHGWGYFTHWLTIITAWILRKNVWLRGENPLSQEVNKRFLVKLIKKAVLQHGLFKLIDKFLYIGESNKDFYTYYGVSKENMIYAPYCVDNFSLEKQYTNMAPQRDLFREQYGIGKEAVLILFSGKYISKKRPMDLIQAFAKLNNRSTHLFMMGDGQLRSSMQDFIDVNGVSNVRLVGFVNQTEIAKYYSMADIFVLPSGEGETWGLVVNEAMLFNLPIIVSATVGCSRDLVSHGVNGFIYEEGNLEQLTSHLATLAQDKDKRKDFGAASKNIVSKFDYSVMIRGIKEVISQNQPSTEKR